MYGQEFKQERLSRQITQEQLAKGTGLNQQKISWIESDEGIPSLHDAKKIADFYGITINELIGLEPKNQTNEKQKTALPALSSSAVNFAKEYQDIIVDKNFIDMSKLYKAVKPELRALMLGYIVGILQSQGVNTQQILKY